jgi:hypothetical protein
MDEVVMRTVTDQAPTVFFALCHSCGYELHEHDRFCRRCGVSQSEHSSQPSYQTLAMTSDDLYHTISGPMVKAVTGEMRAVKTTPFGAALIRPVVLMLISVPIWLMIILLSPLDAYAAARAAAGRIQLTTK